MKKTLTAFAAAAMIATVPLAASTTPAAAVHKQWHKGLATGVGIGVGLGIVNAITQPRQPVVVQQPAPVYVQPAPQPVYGGFSQAHYQWCYDNYKTYDAGSNSFMSNSGYRKPCNSPYN